MAAWKPQWPDWKEKERATRLEELSGMALCLPVEGVREDSVAFCGGSFRGDTNGEGSAGWRSFRGGRFANHRSDGQLIFFTLFLIQIKFLLKKFFVYFLLHCRLLYFY